MTSGRAVLKSFHLGVGGRGQWPIRQATPAAGYAPTLLCDPNPAALESARAACGLDEAACHTDLDAALAAAAEAVDCAIICAPTRLHVPLVKRCVEVGVRHVLVEKGMAPNWADACELVRFVEARRAVVAVAQNYRYQAAPRHIRRWINDPTDPHAIGRPHLVVYQDLRVRPEPFHMTFPFASVWDMSCHHFDLLLAWLGPVESVTAQAWGAPWSAYPHPNNTSAHLVFVGGTHVHYIHTHDSARPSLLVELHGPTGAAVLTEGRLAFNPAPTKNWERPPAEEIPLAGDFGEAGVLADFHRYVVDGVEPGISARRNLEVMAMCELTVRSVEEKRTVRRDELSSR
ncbi:MAG: Gfo/Idh/MocA family oxidoreductase [Gluconacetobacter diazotrophicus]|nr:Gfo/Idh/MocA family oxidoreductase [Gluconacetobacter diazotrophicus]